MKKTGKSASVGTDVLLEGQLEPVGQRLQQPERAVPVRPGALLHAAHHAPLEPDHEQRHDQEQGEDDDDLGDRQPQRVAGEQRLGVARRTGWGERVHGVSPGAEVATAAPVTRTGPPWCRPSPARVVTPLGPGTCEGAQTTSSGRSASSTRRSSPPALSAGGRVGRRLQPGRFAGDEAEALRGRGGHPQPGGPGGAGQVGLLGEQRSAVEELAPGGEPERTGLVGEGAVLASEEGERADRVPLLASALGRVAGVDGVTATVPSSESSAAAAAGVRVNRSTSISTASESSTRQSGSMTAAVPPTARSRPDRGRSSSRTAGRGPPSCGRCRRG